MTQDPDGHAPKDFMGFLEYYLVQKAPFQIPAGGKEWIVRYGPWIMVVLLLLSAPALLVALGVGTFLLPFVVVGAGTGLGVVWVFLVASAVLRALALPGMFARKMSGWQLAFYAQLVDFVGGVLGGTIVGAIIGALIGLYILFQIRSYYRT